MISKRNAPWRALIRATVLAAFACGLAASPATAADFVMKIGTATIQSGPGGTAPKTATVS